MSYHAFPLETEAVFCTEHSVSAGPREPQGFTFAKKVRQSKSVRMAFTTSILHALRYSVDCTGAIKQCWCFFGPGHCLAMWHRDGTERFGALFGPCCGELENRVTRLCVLVSIKTFSETWVFLICTQCSRRRKKQTLGARNTKKLVGTSCWKSAVPGSGLFSVTAC